MDNWLRNPNVIRIVALLISILLWIVVHLDNSQQTPTAVSERNSTRNIENVSIEVVDTVDLAANKLKLVSISQSTVKVTVTGKASAVNGVTPEEAKVLLLLKEAVKGEQRVALTPVGFPENVDVKINPAFVTVTIEDIATREMPVKIDTVGGVKQGFVLGSPIINPNKVFVSLSESALDEIAVIKGEVNVEGADETIVKQVILTAYNNAGEAVEAEIVPPIVEVEVPILHPSKTVPLLIRLNGTPAEGFSLASVEQNPTEVVVFGEQRVLDALEIYEGVTVNIDNINANRTVVLDIPLVSGVSRVEPAKVEVKLAIVQAEQRTIENVSVTIAGVSEANEARIVSPEAGSINVILEGSPEALARINPEDITIIADVANLPTGEHDVRLSYSLPSFVKIVPDNPESVKVAIKETVLEETASD